MKRPLSSTPATAASMRSRSGASGVAVSNSGTAIGRSDLLGRRVDDRAVRAVARALEALRARRRGPDAELGGGRAPERHLGIALGHLAAAVDESAEHRGDGAGE